MAKRKEQYTTRDPEPVTRDPDYGTRNGVPNIPTPPPPPDRKPRRYIPASMPVVCPECGGPTRMADGRHVDPVRKTVLEYRTCARCGQKLAAGRPMVAHEEAQHCRGFEGAVAEYQESIR